MQKNISTAFLRYSPPWRIVEELVIYVLRNQPGGVTFDRLYRDVSRYATTVRQQGFDAHLGPYRSFSHLLKAMAYDGTIELVDRGEDFLVLLKEK